MKLEWETTPRAPALDRPVIQLDVGGKHVYGIPQADGRYKFVCDCDVYPTHLVEVYVTEAQALELDGMRPRSRCIQEILPDVPKELREIFLSGMTPAEFDELMGNHAQAPENYPGYVLPADS
jgi:hypothetical protein